MKTLNRYMGRRVGWLMAGAALVLALAASVPAQMTTVTNRPQVVRSCRDPESGITFYVESDGHHVVALDKDGKILWCRAPATDGKLPPYSDDSPRLNPSIRWIGLAIEQERERMKNTGSGKFVGISFVSKQAGMLDVKNGDFTFAGQD